MDCPKKMCDTKAAVRLPEDPLVDILSRVPVKSVCSFKCVCKAWRDLIADPFHRKKLPQTLEGFFFTGVEGRDSDGNSYDCGSDYGDGGGADGSDDEEPSRQFYSFVDVLKRSVRPVDFSYLSDLPGPGILKETRLLHCCNGLLLFAGHYNGCDISEGYIVCNPATKQCVAVHSSGLTWHQMISESTVTSLLFNPGVYRHFNLVLVFLERYKTSVHVYSSETQAWSRNKIDWDCLCIASYCPGVYINGMLYVLSCWGNDYLIAVDVQGNIKKIIYPPVWSDRNLYIGQSQGYLYYICSKQEVIYDGTPGQVSDRILIWVLQDYDRQQWVLKDSLDVSKMFGKRDCNIYYNVVGVHPYRSLVFLVQCWDQKLVSYNIDSKEVCDLCTLEHGWQHITPYVPYFLEFGS